MGIYAHYHYLSDRDLNILKALDTKDANTLEVVEEEGPLCDLDKMWDAMHCLLVHTSATKPLENNPLSEAIIGVTSIEGIDEYVAYIEKDRLYTILSALSQFDLEKALENFTLEVCQKAELYPNIWNYEEELDEIKEELSDYFYNLKIFYQKVIALNGNVLVTIY